MIVHNRFVSIDGLRTHYLEAGDGPCVVLLHSGEFGGCAELSWEKTIGPLSTHYRIIAPDWLGFGHTDKIHDFVSGTSRRLTHMTRFLEVMAIESAAFIGNSMGGTLLARAAADPDLQWPIVALVLASAGGFLPDNEARRTVQSYDGTPASMRAVVATLFSNPTFPQDDDYIARRCAAANIPGAWECAAAARLRSPVAAARSEFGQPDTIVYEHIQVPTLIIAGDEDRLREPGYAQTIADRIGGSDLKVYEHCGHMPNLEHADGFVDDVSHFLARVFAPSDHDAFAGADR